MCHFSEMKADHEGTIKKMADFLGMNEHSPEAWAKIMEYTSFPWMKAHGDKFEARTVAPVPVLNPGAMVRKGKLGAQAEDGMTPAISQKITQMAEQFVPDAAARKWLFEGGPIPK